MAAYRGKHSRSSSDEPESNKPKGEGRLQPGRPGRRRAQAGSDSTPRPVQRKRAPHTHINRGTSRNATRVASPDASAPLAFKHHDEVHETGARARHSKLKTFLIIVPLVAILAVAGVIIFNVFNTVSDGDDGIEPGIPVTVVIPEGANTERIATILKDASVITEIRSFIRDVQNRNAESQLKPGTYELETKMDSNTLISVLVAGVFDEIGNRLTIAEGLTVEQTAAAVEAATGIKQSDFLERAYAADEYVAEYPFLEGVYNNSLEGFLYPKTYNIPLDSTADYVVRVLLDQFVLETGGLDITYAEEHGMTLFDVITMASLIEKETFYTEERPTVASVIYNRLRDGMRLQIDATVVYALGDSHNPADGVSYADLEIDSPYNTYKIDQLPAGPICSPSIESMEAAAHPTDTNYYYYVLNSEEGYHTFCETSDEFELAKQEYNRIFGIE